MLGVALQKGLLPLSLESVEQAIRLNGVAVADNLHALSWGRLAAHDERKLKALMVEENGGELQEEPIPQTADEIIAHRIRHLTAYQNAAYAKEYADFLDKVRAAEQAKLPGCSALTQAVAWSLAKLMTYKDEYEGARLYTNGDFTRRLKQQFGGDYKLAFNLSPPILNPKDKVTGKLRKIAFGPWMFSAFKVLARFKGLRGTAFDPFGYTTERKRERQLITDYRQLIEGLLPVLTAENHALTVRIAALADTIRGYG
jgi:indolepyruvate ferredoxin oxidoreductase